MFYLENKDNKQEEEEKEEEDDDDHDEINMKVDEMRHCFHFYIHAYTHLAFHYHDVVARVEGVETCLHCTAATDSCVKVNHDERHVDLEAEGQGRLGVIGQH